MSTTGINSEVFNSRSGVQGKRIFCFLVLFFLTVFFFLVNKTFRISGLAEWNYIQKAKKEVFYVQHSWFVCTGEWLTVFSCSYFSVPNFFSFFSFYSGYFFTSVLFFSLLWFPYSPLLLGCVPYASFLVLWSEKDNNGQPVESSVYRECSFTWYSLC